MKYLIQWQDSLGGWHNSPGGVFEDWVDAEVALDWLQEECEMLWKSFPHRIVTVSAGGLLLPFTGGSPMYAARVGQ